MFRRLSELLGAQDMTHGNPMSNLLRFSVPLLIGNFAQQLYSTVDSIVVGHYIGDKALSAIGTTFPILNLLLVLFMAISTGVGIMVAQYFGAKDRHSLSRTIGNAIVLIAGSSVLIMAIGIPAASSLLRLTRTPIETFDMAHTYLSIILLGVLAGGFYNILSGVLRGLGNTFFPLLVLLFTSVLNAVLDIWFVAGLGMGIAGAAWATIISQAISAVVLIYKLASMRDTLLLDKTTMRPQKRYIGELLRLGLPAGATQAIFSMSMVFVQSLTNSMGYQMVTCNTAVMRIDGFAMMPNFTFGMAIATFVGQNIGANKLDRVEEGTKAAFRLSLAISAVLVILLLVFGGSMLHLFTSTEEIIALGIRQIRILALGYFAMAISQIYAGVMRGAGDTMPSLWIGLMTTVGVRVPLAYFLAYLSRSPQNPNGAPESIFFSLLTSWVMGAFFNFLWYRRGEWRKKSLIGAAETTTAS